MFYIRMNITYAGKIRQGLVLEGVAEPGDREGRHYAGPSHKRAGASVVAGPVPVRSLGWMSSEPGDVDTGQGSQKR